MHYPVIQALRAAGYKVVQRSPWHYQVVHRLTTVNLWPTKNKWMVEYDSGASLYKDAADLLKSILSVSTTKHLMPPMTEAEKVWREGLIQLFDQLSTH